MADAAVQAAIYKMGLDASDYQRGSQIVEQSNERVIDSFTRIEAKYDPLIRAEQRRQAAVAQANRFLEEGRITQERYAQQMERVNRVYEQQVAAAQRAGVAVANSNRMLVGSFRTVGGQIQNAAFQVGDFFVQVASGTGVMRAAAQQLPQLLQGFGVLGAVAGAAVSVLALLVTQLDIFGDSTDDAAADQEKLNDRLKQMSDIMDELQGKAAPTRAALEASRRGLLGISESDVQNRIRDLERELAKTPEGGAEIKPEFGGTIPLARAEVERTTEELKAMRVELLVLKAEAGEFGDRFSGSTKNAQDALKSLRKEEEDAKHEAERLADSAAREAEREAEQRARARQAIEDQIDALFREARQIGMTSAERAADIELHKAEATARRAGIELTEAEIISVQAAAEAKQQAADAAEELKEAERERLRVVRQLEREQERAAKEQERDLERQRELLLDQLSIFRDLVDGTFDWKEALVDVFETILSELAKLEDLGGEGGGLFGAGGIFQSILGSIVPGLFGGVATANLGGSAPGIPPIKPFAEGGEGVVSRPTLFLAGERGAEHFSFTPMSKAGARPTAGGDSFFINAPGADKAGLLRLERMIRTLDASIERRVDARAIGGRRRGGRYAEAFG